MRNVLIAFATLAATTTIAAAQPALTAAAPAPAATANDSYVGLSMTAGADDVGIYGGWVVDGGRRISDHTWAHVGLTLGGMAGVDEPVYASHFSRAQAGLETRRCVLDGAACAVLGADVAYRDEQLMAEYDQGARRGLAGIARAGLDTGSKHFRFRPSLEGLVDSKGLGGVGVTAGLAYQW